MTKDLVKIDDSQQQGQTWINRKEPIVDFCCCGCSLRTGCLIIGWLNMVGVMIASVALIFVIYMTVSRDYLNNPDTPEETASQLKAILIVVTIFVAFEGIFNGFLLSGTYKKKPKHLNCYLIYFVVKSCLSVVVSLVEMILTGVIVRNLLSLPIGLALAIYFALVVESYRRVLIKEQNSPPFHEVQNDLPPSYAP